MALIGGKKNSRRGVRRVALAARRIELKNAARRSAVNKNLRRAPARSKKNRGFWGGIWLRIRAPLGWGFGIALGLLIFSCTGVGLLYAYKFFTTSPYFAVKTIEIQGQNRLKSREVLETAGVDYGQNTLALSMDELESALSRNPWIAELSIRRVLPDGIEIKIREYEPRYWVKQGGDLVYADEYGSPIAPVSTGTFASYPLLEVEGGAEYLTARLPELAGSLERMNFPVNLRSAAFVRLTAARGLEVSLDGGLRLSVGIDGWEANIKNLVRVLEDLSRRGELKNAAEIKAHGQGVWVAAKKRQV
jgi:cell division protein FtsQ